jgi:hypothetical protein
MVDDRSDIELVRAILQRVVAEQEQGRDPREVLREVWLEATAVLLAARQQRRGEPD